MFFGVIEKPSLLDEIQKNHHEKENRMKSPVFTKREPRPYDYQEMTWEKFIRLREWAKKAANEIGYPIYLVGSTLQKTIPRDFDVSIEIPLVEFENKFGKITEDNWPELLVKSFNEYVEHYFNCVETLGEFGHTPLDFKVIPDTWVKDKDKLLLAEPKG